MTVWGEKSSFTTNTIGNTGRTCGVLAHASDGHGLIRLGGRNVDVRKTIRAVITPMPFLSGFAGVFMWSNMVFQFGWLYLFGWFMLAVSAATMGFGIRHVRREVKALASS